MRAPAKATGKAALAFTVASFGGAALNYLYQVHAVALLDATAFGLLSTWLARVTLLGMIATVVQFVSLDHPLEDARWRLVARLMGALSLVVFAAHVALGSAAPQLALGASAVAGGILLYALLGQLQARLQLGVMAFATAAVAVARFALPFGWPRDGRAPAFYVAHAASSFAGIIAVALVVGRRPAGDHTTGTEPKEKELRLWRPLLLSFAAVLFPLLDILVVSSTQDAATTGAFSRVSLMARIVFFCGAAALQILLSHELHAATTGEPLPSFVRLLQRALTPLALAGALVLAVGLDRVVFHATGEERTWLYASSFSFALLVAILGHVNRFAARGELGVATAIVVAVLAAVGLAAVASALAPAAPVSRYVLVALGGDAVVLLGAGLAQMRARRGARLR